MAFRIAYAQGQRIELGVCAWRWSFIIIIDEWVVSLYFGLRPMDVSRFQSIKRNINNECWEEQEGIVTPSGERPNSCG